MNLKEISQASSELIKRIKLEPDLKNTIGQVEELKELIIELKNIELK